MSEDKVENALTKEPDPSLQTLYSDSNPLQTVFPSAVNVLSWDIFGEVIFLTAVLLTHKACCIVIIGW